MTGAEPTPTPRSRATLSIAAYVVFLVVALAFGLWWRTVDVLEAWLIAFLVLAGLASASLGLLMIGQLLGESWLRPVRSPLEAAASTTPLVALLAIPLAAGVELLYPWAAGSVPGIPQSRQLYFSEPLVLFRAAAILIIWIGVAILGLRRGRDAWASATGLFLLAVTAAISALDWVSSREPAWWSSLFAFAYTVTQLSGAMALALLVAMARPNYPHPHRYHSLQRATITLALLTFWVWFAQFLVIWMANLPGEAAWYLKRADAGWLWLKVVVIMPSLLIAIVLLLPTEPGRWRLVFAAAFLLLSHLAHMLWIVRPSSIALPMLTQADLPVWLGLGLLWWAWFTAALHAREAVSEPARGSAPA